MARLPRICPPGIPQHIIQRGNNRQVCFAGDGDYAAYAHWLDEASKKHDVLIHAWIFMTNHVHLLVTPQTNNGISKMMQVVGRHYVRYFNCTYKRSGTLWEGRLKSCVIDAEDYLLICQRYIELNPVRAGMVDSPSLYRWSSYHTNGLGKQSGLISPHELYQQLGDTVTERMDAYRRLFDGHIDQYEISTIRTVTNKGLALGSNRFRDEIERLTGRRLTPLKPGPKSAAMGIRVEKKQEFLL